METLADLNKKQEAEFEALVSRQDNIGLFTNVGIQLDSPLDEKFSHFPQDEVIKVLTDKYNQVLKGLGVDYTVQYKTGQVNNYKNGWYCHKGIGGESIFSVDDDTLTIPFGVSKILEVLQVIEGEEKSSLFLTIGKYNTCYRQK